MSAKNRSAKPKPLLNFAQTESGNAEMFAAVVGNDVRYDDKQGHWLIWNGQRWRVDGSGRAMRRYMKLAIRRRLKQAFKLPSDDPRRLKEIKWCSRSESRYSIDAALELAKSEPPIVDDGEGWDNDPWRFGVANGIFDLRTGQLRAATRQDRITKFSPVKFDPQAPCPRWMQFLDEIFLGNAPVIRFVQKAAGYSMTGSVVEHVIIVLYGTGRNGKTTLLEIFLQVLGDYGTDVRFAILEANRRAAPGEGVNLMGARFAKSVETKRGRHLDEGRIKAWTGGDTLSVRPLYRNDIHFSPTHKLWLAVNDKPEIDDSSPAMWERIRLVPFERRFVGHDRDKDLLEKLKGEASGILNWMIQGCLAWQQEGLEAPETVEHATREYAEDSDPLSAFVKERCEVGAGFEVGRGELYDAYRKWCEEGGQEPLKIGDFKSRMAQKFSPGRSGHDRKRVWKGLRLQELTGDADSGQTRTEISINSPIGSNPEELIEKLCPQVSACPQRLSLAELALPMEDE